MSETMTWSKVSNGDPLCGVMSLLDQVVTDYRNRGHTRTIATEEAARALGITPRRAKSLLYGEAFKVQTEEYRAIKEKYLDHLDAEAANLAARFQAIMEKRQQLGMDI
jgi:hypothetical protein